MSTRATQCRAALLRARKRGGLEHRTTQMILAEYGAMAYANNHWGMPDGSVLVLVADGKMTSSGAPLYRWRAYSI
jgi:hypothetical protein